MLAPTIAPQKTVTSQDWRARVFCRWASVGSDQHALREGSMCHSAAWNRTRPNALCASLRCRSIQAICRFPRR